MRKSDKYSKKLRYLAAALAFSFAGGGLFLPAADALPKKAITVSRYVFEGETMASDAELQALLGEYVGKQATLLDLERQAAIVTNYLRARGSMVAMAYVPPQEFDGGGVRIVVTPGRYDEIIIDNTTNIHEAAIRRELGDKIRPGEIVEKKSLERAVFLISDLANADAKTTLKAGAKPGTTTLTIHVKPKGNDITGYVGFDNSGYRYTGIYEWSTLINYANMAREGDLMSGSFLYTGQGQSSGGVTYGSPFWNQGSRWGVSYARSQYALGSPFEGSTGWADTVSLSYQKNLVRSRDANSYAGLRYDSKRLRDDMDLGSTDWNGRKSAHNWVADIHGDWRDGWQGGGFNTYAFSYTRGDLGIDDEVSRILDMVENGGHGTEGGFGKYNLALSRLQRVRDRLDLFCSYSQQWADKNLDSSEKLTLGGPYAVRAYPIGEASGDQGWLSTLELRWNLPKKDSEPDAWQLIAFVDGGGVRINKHPGVYDGDNDRELYGWGVGVNWSNENNWAARLHYARKIGSESAQSDKDRNGRLWFQLYKFF